MNHAITDEILNAIILAMQNETFESHDVIFGLMRRHSREYTADLNACLVTTDGDTIISLHKLIGRRLRNLGTITPTVRKISMNSRGLMSDNQVWRRH